jgi:uncharacterized SAM-binding protein YcdF (DUF218 family)
LRISGKRPTYLRGCLFCCLGLVVVAAILWSLRYPLLTWAGRILVEDDGAHRADAVVVLAGDEYGTRVLKGAELSRSGYARYVLVSERITFGDEDCQPSVRYAESKGFPSAMFRTFRHSADSTRAEVADLDRYFKQHDIHSILLVTSNYHTRRAAKLMRQADPALAVAVIPAPDPYFSPAAWWKSRTGQKTFLLEWMKTVATDLGD